FGLERSMSVGAISSLNRTLEVQQNWVIKSIIQIDASINPGNSGGPLLNLRGEVVGMNTAIAPLGQGLGFSTPINKARLMMPQLLRGEVVRAWLGVSTQPVTAKVDRELNLDGRNGALVVEVAPKSPADRAGLREKDLITGIDGEVVTDPRALALKVAELQVGSTVRFTIRRDGKSLIVPVVLGRQP
ncbi:MAG: PDZ domain-containing protein, partial [Myxococcales bacterium]|nr:PDZ domain-containing protein [Myxococcales bacterium]